MKRDIARQIMWCGFESRAEAILGEFMLSIYTQASSLAMSQSQTVGEKGNYYVTLEQLERLLEARR